MVRQHFDGGGVLAAVGHDDVGVALAGLHKSFMHGLDGGQVLLDHAVQTAAPLLDVPHQTAQDALVGVGVHKDLVVEHGAQLRLHKGQDALHDQHRSGFDVLHLVAAVMVGVVVYRAVDGAPGLQLLQVIDEQGVVKGVRVVVVQLAALFKGQIVVALVVAVVGDQAHLVLAELLFQPQGKGGFAAAGAACNADDQVVHSCYSSCAEICRFWWKKRTEWFIIKAIVPPPGAADSPAASSAFIIAQKRPFGQARNAAADRSDTARKIKWRFFHILSGNGSCRSRRDFCYTGTTEIFYRRKHLYEQDFTDRHRRHSGGL